MGLGAYPASDRQWLGMLGMHGTYEANMAMHDCDVMDGAIHGAGGPDLHGASASSGSPTAADRRQAGWTAGHLAAGALGDPRRRAELRRGRDNRDAAGVLLRQRAGGGRRARRPRWRSRWSAGIYGWPRGDAIAAAVDTLRRPRPVSEAFGVVAFGHRSYDEITEYLKGAVVRTVAFGPFGERTG